MLTKSEQDKWKREATAEAVAILQLEVCAIVREMDQMHEPGNEAIIRIVGQAFDWLTYGLALQVEGLRDD
jgi:hypothetical protein